MAYELADVPARARRHLARHVGAVDPGGQQRCLRDDLGAVAVEVQTGHHRAHLGTMNTPSASTVMPSSSARYPTANVLTPSVCSTTASVWSSPRRVPRR